MIEKIEKLQNRENEVKLRISNVRKAIWALYEISKTDRVGEFPTFIGLLEDKSKHLKGMQMRVQERIKKEQNKCLHRHPDGQDAHIYQSTGHNSSYYYCVYCNHYEER